MIDPDIFNKNLLNSLVLKNPICLGWISSTLKNSHSETPKEFRSLLRKPKAVKALSKLGVDPQNALDNGILASRFSLSWFRGFLDGGFRYFLFSSLPGEMIQFD